MRSSIFHILRLPRGLFPNRSPSTYALFIFFPFPHCSHQTSRFIHHFQHLFIAYPRPSNTTLLIVKSTVLEPPICQFSLIATSMSRIHTTQLATLVPLPYSF